MPLLSDLARMRFGGFNRASPTMGGPQGMMTPGTDVNGAVGQPGFMPTPAVGTPPAPPGMAYNSADPTRMPPIQPPAGGWATMAGTPTKPLGGTSGPWSDTNPAAIDGTLGATARPVNSKAGNSVWADQMAAVTAGHAAQQASPYYAQFMQATGGNDRATLDAWGAQNAQMYSSDPAKLQKLQEDAAAGVPYATHLLGALIKAGVQPQGGGWQIPGAADPMQTPPGFGPNGGGPGRY